MKIKNNILLVLVSITTLISCGTTNQSSSVISSQSSLQYSTPEASIKNSSTENEDIIIEEPKIPVPVEQASIKIPNISTYEFEEFTFPSFPIIDSNEDTITKSVIKCSDVNSNSIKNYEYIYNKESKKLSAKSNDKYVEVLYDNDGMVIQNDEYAYNNGQLYLKTSHNYSFNEDKTCKTTMIKKFNSEGKQYFQQITKRHEFIKSNFEYYYETIQINDDEEYIQTILIREYDKYGNKTYSYYYYGNSRYEGYKYSNSFIYTYDQNGNITEISYGHSYNGNEYVERVLEKTYDEKGRNIYSVFKYCSKSGAETILSYCITKYNDSNNSVFQYDSSEESSYEPTATTTFYDDRNNIIAKYIWNKNDDGTLQEKCRSCYKYEYDSHNNIISIQAFGYNSEGIFNLCKQINYTYDSKNNIIDMTTYSKKWKDKLTFDIQIEKSVYKYDNNDNLLSCINYVTTDINKKFVCDSYEIYQYSENYENIITTDNIL